MVLHICRCQTEVDSCSITIFFWHNCGRHWRREIFTVARTLGSTHSHMFYWKEKWSFQSAHWFTGSSLWTGCMARDLKNWWKRHQGRCKWLKDKMPTTCWGSRACMLSLFSSYSDPRGQPWLDALTVCISLHVKSLMRNPWCSNEVSISQWP